MVPTSREPPAATTQVGNLWAPDAFAVAWRAPEPGDPAALGGLDFVVDPLDDTCRLVFSRDAAFAFLGSRGASAVLRCDVKLEFSFLDVAEVLAFQNDDSLLLRLSAAPLLYYRTAADDVHQPVPFDLLDDDDDDPWIRTTDITPSGAIGRCWVYRVSFKTWLWPEMKDALAYMKGQQVPVVLCGIGCRGLNVNDEQAFGQPTDGLFFSVQYEGLRFPVLFLVNVLVHKGIVNEHQLTSEFFGLLEKEEDDVNVAALTELLGEKFQVFYLWRRLKNAQSRAAENNKLLRLHSSRKVTGDHNAEVRSMVIAPTRAYCLPPQVELSNRVIRHYHRVADRLLRVTFMDEGMQPLNINALNLYAAPIVKDMMSNSLQQKTTVHRRVRTILTKGFHMCGRKYSFLAFSSNQLRKRSAWFFAEDGTITTASIREWMGQFPSNNVAKHAARMGQCFTSSYATVLIQPYEVNEFLEDVEHNNGYNFSDGIGKITPGLAMEVAKRLPLMHNYPPSAYQIRYAGFKGVLAVWSGQNDGIRISLRPSMRKFESTHSVLEVVSWTKFQPAFLNRQIITLLTSLGVPDSIFWQIQGAMLHNLDRILSDRDAAYQVVTTSCSEHGTIPGLMLSARFTPETKPHLKAMLLAIKSSQLQGLLEKTKIFVPKGRWLMGCLDELGILEQGQCFIRASVPSLNKYFGKHGSRFSSGNKSAEVIVGTIVMAKNPCLHPGDVRILEAVDVPELHHLVDCLVFPKKGVRPHPNEESGSDLDGDVYFVTWDENLVPPRKQSWTPMDYSPVHARQLLQGVRQHDIIDFFLRNMVSEILGPISNAHVVHADRSKYGAMDDKCIQLAELAATAVDFPKTGKIVTMPPFLRPQEYPDFMGKEDDISYKSEKILGRLYRSIQQYMLMLGNASAWYESKLNGLLNQYSVRTEAELVTGEIWSLTERNKRRKNEIKERLKHAYSKLHQEFRNIFESIGADHGESPEEKKMLVYEMKASAWYQVTYHPKWIQALRETSEFDGKEMPARLSFPWIAVDYLTRIKMRRRGQADAISRDRGLRFQRQFSEGCEVSWMPEARPLYHFALPT
ncbi:putative RNA-dependent RNA polymerase SHL2 [Panicum miliaceum]|uniref:RNA-dependent RNA polymerase n=1 Tax=Panicum miliaceum TaxID=4540 RepID=A0A3L6PTK9_PANMI|nr:putative RNA-dependent RNA polymerase SHL2 [Panicum miliaceum]